MDLANIWAGPGIAAAAAEILFIVAVLQAIDLPLVGALPKGTKAYAYAVTVLGAVLVGLAGAATHQSPGIANVTAAALTFVDIVGLALGVRAVSDVTGTSDKLGIAYTGDKG